MNITGPAIPLTIGVLVSAIGAWMLRRDLAKIRASKPSKTERALNEATEVVFPMGQPAILINLGVIVFGLFFVVVGLKDLLF